MRLPHAEHTSQPWRIHELTPDFRIEDVWMLPTPGAAAEFPALVEMITRGDPERSSSMSARALWAVRWKVGEVLGWDGEDSVVGSRVSSLRERFPPDLRGAPTGPAVERFPFDPLYMLEREWAAEIANRTMHGVLHLGWVPDGEAGFRGQLTVLVKPNGLFGEAYMAAIKPFRYLIVYPAMMRMLERDWQARPVGSER